VAFSHWAAGLKRVLSFAYLLVWSWTEHVEAAMLRNEDPTNRLILIVDEIESHLHPKWQRAILPAFLKIASSLDESIEIQILTATHSPLVLASLEPHVQEEADRLFWFDLRENDVHFQLYPWAKHGDVIGWLTSPIFGLKEARSLEAEVVLDAAEAFMAADAEAQPENLRTEENIQQEMRRVLPGDDPIWSRWLLKTQGGIPQ
jgi:AAA domain, putative AbiEii toxin, Type IV TA system